MKRIKFLFGYLIYKLFATHLPQSYLKINKFSHSLRAFCGRLIFEKSSKRIAIGRKTIINRNIIIGDRSGIGENCAIYGTCFIGDNVLMAPECIIYTINHKFMDKNKLIIDQGIDEEKPVHIGNDVWIGRRVIILPGVKVGDGSVIAAGSIVTKDVPPYTVVGGNPAKFIKERI